MRVIILEIMMNSYRVCERVNDEEKGKYKGMVKGFQSA